jgi:hypothetical protein
MGKRHGWNLLCGQYQTTVYDPDLDRGIDLKPRLLQPVALELNPWHWPSGPSEIILKFTHIVDFVHYNAVFLAGFAFSQPCL